MALHEPVRDGAVKQRKMPGEEVIGAVDQDEPIFSRKHGDEFFDFLRRAVFVVGAVDESSGFTQPERYVKSESFTGTPSPIRSVTRGSAHPIRNPTQLPKLKPPSSRGVRGNSVARKSMAA